MKPWLNHALQRPRLEPRGCNRGVPWAWSLSLGRYGKKMKLLAACLIAALSLSAMADDKKIKFDADGYPELTQMAEEGFVDMVFRIRDTHVDEKGWTTLTVDAKNKGEKVGFKLAVRPDMRPGIVGNDIDRTAFSPKGIILLRDGKTSDALLRAFESLYEVPRRESEFRNRAEVTAFALSGDPRKLKTDYVKFKIFHDDQDERGEYFELYLHVNIPGGVVALNEKDQEYRHTVLKGLEQTKP